MSAAVSTFPLGANGVDKMTAGAPTHTSTGIVTVTYAHQLVSVVPVGAHVVIRRRRIADRCTQG